MTSGPWPGWPPRTARAAAGGAGPGTRSGGPAGAARVEVPARITPLSALPLPYLHPAATPPPVHACMHYTSGQRRCPLLPGAGQAAEAHSLAPTDDSFQDHEWNNCQKLREKKQAPRLLYTDTACVRACDSCRQPRFGHKLSSIIRDKTSNCLYGKRGFLSPIQKNKQLRR